MDFSRIFELIRKGEVVIFCGAGMSMYAGYPSGWELSRLIYQSMSDSERSCVNENLTLPDLVEEYINLKLGKRNALLDLLKKTFLKEADFYHIHEIVGRIPQLKTIITTNYDCLFEKVLGGKCSVVRSSADIPYLDKGKVELLKIHGDLSIPDSILISKSDYTKFFDTQRQELVWTLVKERLATKNVLFVGYSLEDINMESIFRKITEELGNNSREVFLLSPNEKEHKVQSLNRRGIHYINSIAETFFVELEQSIKDNVNDDFRKGWIDSETYRKVFQQYDLNPSLKASDDKFELISVSGLKKPWTAEVKISLPADKREQIDKLTNLFGKRDIAPLTLDEEIVKAMILKLNGIQFPISKDFGVEIKPSPGLVTEIDIVFANNREYERVKLEVYKTIDHLIFVALLPCAKLVINVPNDNLENFPHLDLNISFDHQVGYKKISEEMETYRFMLDFVTSGGMTVFHPQAKEMRFGLGVEGDMKKECEKHLDYFGKLRKIERYFGVRFGDIKDINNKDYDMACWLLDIASGEEQLCDFDQDIVFQTTMPEKIPSILNEFDKEGGVNFTHNNSEPSQITLHQTDINIGYQITRLISPYIANKNEIEKDPTANFIIKSKSNQRAVRFVRDNPSLAEAN